MKYAKKELIKMYHDLARGRIFIERLHTAVSEGMIRNSLHSAYGQEAVDVGILSAMRDTDWLVPNHRSQAALIMRLDPYGFFAEVCAKADGTFKGVAYDYHMADLADGKRIIPNSAVLGGQAPTATGFAFALKHKGKTGEVVVATYGEGSASEGPTNEAYNLASLYKPPIVYAIINNEWAMTVPLCRQTANPSVSERAVPYGLPAQIVNGYDILKVREGMEKALELARQGQPNVIEFKILRWSDHFVGQGGAFRQDKDRILYDLENNDPVKLYENYLIDNGVLDRQHMDEFKEKVSTEYAGMAERIKAAPFPAKEEVFKKEYIYASAETGGDI